MNVVELSEELKKRAETEIGEKAAWRDRDVQALQDQLASDTTLMVPQEYAFGLRFLRASKFDYEAAHQLVLNYYKIQTTSSELFTGLASCPGPFEDTALTVLPKRTANNEAIIVFLPSRWNTDKYSFDDVLSAFVVTVENLLLDEINQVTGIVAVIDMSNISWSQIKNFGPLQAKKVIHLVEEALPARITQIHVINRSQLARLALQVIKPFLSEEITTRSHLYADLDNFHRVLGVDILPSELGGDCGPIEGQWWLDALHVNEQNLSKYWAKNGFGLVPSGDPDELDMEEEVAGNFLSRQLAAVRKEPLIENLKDVQNRLPSCITNFTSFSMFKSN